ncbi:uncharacterized protein LOC134751509 [Cydia strobilella]|uniref:uncharacterized protein LOC134751509 n=1 Tax=Cydia strobilella TaxID=1100964 RepID=UPI00300507FF
MRVIKKYKPNILSNKERQIVPVTQMGSTQILVRRHRRLSGIYPIAKELVPVGGVGVRNSEGKMSALTAFIHKPQDDSYTRSSKRQRLLSIYPIGKELVRVEGVGVRNSKGKMSALAAFIHKPQDGSCARVGVGGGEGKMSALTTFIHKPQDDSCAVGVGGGEGKMSALTTFIHKPQDNSYTSTRSNNSLKHNIELTLQDIINGNVEQATSLDYPNDSLRRNIEVTLQDVINGNVEQATSLDYPNDSLRRNIEVTLQDINGNVEQATSLNYPNTSGILSYLKRSNNSLKRNIERTLQDRYLILSYLKRSNNSLKRNIELTLQDVINGNVEQATSLDYPNDSLRRNIEVTLQDINGNVEQATSLNYPNTSGVEAVPEFTEVTPESTTSVYYHKKIRAEQVRERRNTLNTRCELPRINEAFGQFRGNDVRHDVTQPLHVQVSEESERILNYPQFAKRNTSLLETLYNFKSQFLTNQPLLQLATTTNTKCVYSTPTVATAAPQRPGTTYTEPYMAFNIYVAHGRDQYYGNMDNSRLNDCLKSADQDYDFRCYEDPNRSSSSIGTAQSQDLGANVTISDMVEDALELISQDGDYMERMGMDVKMQCVLCNWAGPKMIVEYHIRKEHSNDIDKREKREWNITYSLGSVHQHLWKSRVIEHESALFVLSVKYDQTGCLLATLAAARMEYDAIQRARRDMECHQYSMYQLQQNRIKQAQEKERLKQETLYFRGLWDKAIKDEEEAERCRVEARHKTGHDRALAIEERKLTLEKQAHEQQVIQDAWASLGEQGVAQEKAKEELRRRKEREQDECNRKMIELRNDLRASDSANDDFIRDVATQYQKVVDEKRCQYLSWSQKTNRDVRKAMIDQIHDRKQALEELQKKLLEQDEYHHQLFNQLSQLAAHKDLTDAQQRKKHQENLLKQIEYNKLLKERALQEEQEQIKKCQRATEEYNQEISRMLCRPFYSDMQHPFLRQMAGGLKMREKCPCSKPDYCAVPDKKPT